MLDSVYRYHLAAEKFVQLLTSIQSWLTDSCQVCTASNLYSILVNWCMSDLYSFWSLFNLG